MLSQSNAQTNGQNGSDGRVTLAELNRRLDQAYDELIDVKQELERRIHLKRRRDARHRAHKRQEAPA